MRTSYLVPLHLTKLGHVESTFPRSLIIMRLTVVACDKQSEQSTPTA